MALRSPGVVLQGLATVIRWTMIRANLDLEPSPLTPNLKHSSRLEEAVFELCTCAPRVLTQVTTLPFLP